MQANLLPQHQGRLSCFVNIFSEAPQSQCHKKPILIEEFPFQAVSLNETQRSEMCIPQWAVSVELDSLNLESFVIGNGLHRSPVQAGAPSVVNNPALEKALRPAPDAEDYDTSSLKRRKLRFPQFVQSC